MSKYTPFGRIVKKLLVDIDEKQDKLAAFLCVKPSLVSAVFTGRKPISDSFLSGTLEYFKARQDKLKAPMNQIEILIKNKAAISVKHASLPMHGLTDEDRALAVAFVKNFNDLSADQKNQVKALLKEAV